LRSLGYKTGLYTSPHLSDIRERFRIDGRWISSRDFKRLSNNVLSACAAVKKSQGHLPTHFEALTALAFLWFKEQKADWVVLETGLGGRLDATNIIPAPATALITPIGLEHQDILGKDIQKIAGEKAGILKPGTIAATHQVHPQALRTIENIAREKRVPLWVSGRDFTFFKTRKGFRWEGPGLRNYFYCPRIPDFQMANAALALAGLQTLRAQGVDSAFGILQRGLEKARWPGRMEVLGNAPLVLLDGAHNPEAAQALVGSLRKSYPKQKWIVLNGFLKDKDYRKFSEIMKPVTALSVVTAPENERAEDGRKVFEAWERTGVRSLWIRRWKEALGFAMAKSGSRESFPLLITGSLYLLGDCRKELRGLKGLDLIEGKTQPFGEESPPQKWACRPRRKNWTFMN
jgi:dihydrofolate synthase/folylpolyglutamate synthase